MYGVHPAKNSDDAVGGEATEVIRTYQTWKGSNVFFLGGRIIFGPDVRSVFLSIFLIVAPVAVFCAFVARKLLDEFAHHLGILVMVIAIVFTSYVVVLLLITSGRDPGIIPRNTHPPEPEIMDQSLEIGSSQTPQLRLPRIKEVIVNGMTVKVKYCDTCMLYRPPRCSHCSICDNCVERFDHHCPWVGQCIGLRNYRFFFMFVSSATLLCIYVFAFCWVYVIKIMKSEETSIWGALVKTPASIVLIIYTFICVWFVGGLTVFHLYLISTNQVSGSEVPKWSLWYVPHCTFGPWSLFIAILVLESTYENFRYRYDQTENPYNRGVVANLKEVFWNSIPPSKNKFRAVVQREVETFPHPGYVNSNIEKTPSDVEMGNRKLPPGMGVDQMSGNDRRSSWGRRSGSWDLPSDIASVASALGDSNRIVGGSSHSLDRQ